MSTRIKRRIVIAAVALGVAGLGGTALATSSSGGGSFLDDVAHRLGISPAKLQSAVDGALADRLDQMVKQGELTRAQADAILKHAEANGGGFPWGGWAPFHRGHGFGGPGDFGFDHPGVGPGLGPGPIGGPLAAAASYLGISNAELVKELHSGRTLATIAKAKGKSVSGLESALVAPMKTRLDEAVKAGHLTTAQEQHVLAILTRGIDGFVTHGFRFGMRMQQGWDHDGERSGGSSQPAAFGL